MKDPNYEKMFPDRKKPTAEEMTHADETARLLVDNLNRNIGAVDDSWPPKVQEAIATARRLHQGQFRKGMKTHVPYISHRIAVVELVMKYSDDEDILVAAALHDTVEDCGYSFKKIERQFGKKAADLVRELTEDVSRKKKDPKGTWRERKEKYLAHLRAASPGAILICWADKVHNLESMVVGFDELGRDEFWSRFNATPRDSAWYYGEIKVIFRSRLDAGPLQEFERILDEARPVFDGDAKGSS
jgi:(p)ppGpp synthase/HD superfamily hydrolase